MSFPRSGNEYLLVTAHGVDYLLSTERHLRRARWSLVGGRGVRARGVQAALHPAANDYSQR
jgi:hypothetical protein